MNLSKEDLLAISSLFDKRFDRIDSQFEKNAQQFEKIDLQFNAVNTRLDKMDGRITGLESGMDSRIAGLESGMDGRITGLESGMDSRITGLESRMESIESWQKRFALIQENEVLPQLRNIQECYVSTYKRYKDYSDRMDDSFVRLHLVEETVKKHSEKLNRILA